MGNTALSQNKNQDVMQKYCFVQNITEGKSLYKNKKTQKQYVSVERTFPTYEMLFQYQKKMRKTLEISHPYFLNQTEHAMITSSTLCSMQYRVIHFFQNQSHTLDQELEIRKKHEKYFQQKEIWSILCSSVLTMSHLTKLDILCYRLHPRDIIIDKMGMIKVLSPLLVDNGLQVVDDIFYYSPEHLKALKSSNFSTLSNKSSVFTLGITLLHILSLQPMNELYDYQNCAINMQLLNQLIQKITQTEIKDIVKKMLKFQTYDRITFTELEEMLYDVLEGQNDEKQSKKSSQTRAHEISTERFSSSLHRFYQTGLQFDDDARASAALSQTSMTSREQLPDQKSKGINIRLQYDQQDTGNPIVYESNIDVQKMDEEDTKQREDKQQQIRSSQFTHQQISIVADSRISLMGQSNITRNALQERQNSNVIVKNESMGKTTSSQFKMCSRTQQKTIYTNQTSRPYHVRQEMTLGTYEGYKLNNWRHGYGVFYYAQGGKYSGEWFKNKMHGKGALYYGNEQIAYEGEWNNDRLHGYGILYNQIPTFMNQPLDYKCLHLVDNYWVKYEGNFYEDQKNGQGTLFISNGEYYRGYFKEGLPHGNGIYKCMNGNVIKGNWILGMMQ